MIHANPHLKIAGTGSYVPRQIVTNKDLTDCIQVQVFSAQTGQHTLKKLDPKWAERKLGIKQRRYASWEYTSEMALFAAKRTLTNARVQPHHVGAIIVATSTPDRKAPSTACIVQNKLGITNGCVAFDIQAVCSGFLYALTIGSQMIAGGTKNVLVIGADRFSSITNTNSPQNVFFGDGAGAVLLQRRDKGFFLASLHADGRGKDNFTVYPTDTYFTMDGKAVYETGIKVLPIAINRLLADPYVSGPKAIDHVIPHQPSIHILKETAKRTGIPFRKFHTNMDQYGNTAGATIPLLLDQVNRKKKLKRGDKILFAAVGSGWTWGAAVCEW